MGYMRVSQSQLLAFGGGSVLVSFGVNVASSSWPGHEWLWGALGLVAVLAIFLVPADGLLRRHKYGRARWVRILALLMLISYPLVLWRLSSNAGFLGLLVPALCLWIASVLLLSASGSVHASSVALASANVLCALAFSLGGFRLFSEGQPIPGSGLTLIGVSILLFGAYLLLGSGRSVLGLAFVAMGVALGLLGLSYLHDDYEAVAIIHFTAGLAVLLVGVAILLKAVLLGAIAALVGLASYLALGAVMFRSDWGIGLSITVGGLGIFMMLASAFRPRLAPLASILMGIGTATMGVRLLVDSSQYLLLGIAILFAALGLILIGTVSLQSGSSIGKAFSASKRWLSYRPELPYGGRDAENQKPAERGDGSATPLNEPRN